MSEREYRLSREEEEWCQVFEQELRLTEDAGIPVFLDGKKEDLRTIAEACMIRENGPYICRYAADEGGLKLCFLKAEAGKSRRVTEDQRQFFRLFGHAFRRKE